MLLISSANIISIIEFSINIISKLILTNFYNKVVKIIIIIMFYLN